MKVYEALFCGCIYEDSYSTISIHKTKSGARKALAAFLRNIRREERDNPSERHWSRDKAWDIHETEVFE